MSSRGGAFGAEGGEGAGVVALGEAAAGRVADKRPTADRLAAREAPLARLLHGRFGQDHCCA